MGERIRWDMGRAVRVTQTPSGLVKQRRDRGPWGLRGSVLHHPQTGCWPPLGLGPLPHLLYTPPLLSLPACSRALTSFPLPPLKREPRPGVTSRPCIDQWVQARPQELRRFRASPQTTYHSDKREEKHRGRETDRGTLRKKTQAPAPPLQAMRT